MRPLSFENLRRLVGRKKDRNEPSFKRSESFKRISIRKSYLDRGKRRNRLQKNLEPAANPQPVTNDKASSQRRVKDDEQEPTKHREACSQSRDSITYDEWLHGVSSSSREKLHEDHHFVESPSSQQSNVSAKKSLSNVHADADSVAEDLKILELDASPISTHLKPKPFRIADHVETTNGHDVLWSGQESSTEGPPSVSISLGRIWRDAVPVPVAVPTSAPPYTSVPAPAVHHSLDSALKEKKPQPTVARTVSAPEKGPLGKDTASSSSSFGFSLRIAKLADFRPG